MPTSIAPDPKTARRAIDLYVKLTEALREDGYGQDVIEELTLEHLIALTHGRLQEPDGTLMLPSEITDTSRATVSDRSEILMTSLTMLLNELGHLPSREKLSNVVATVARSA